MNYTAFTDRWKSCTRCDIGKCKRKVFGRGVLPADIMFIGEAPGFSEIALGKAFVGPAGKLLDRLIAQSTAIYKYSYWIDNSVICFPDDGNGRIRHPSIAEIKNCRDRLAQAVLLANPKAVVLLGRTAELAWGMMIDGSRIAATNGFADIPLLKLRHPAWVIRRGGGTSREYADTLSDLLQFVHTLFKNNSRKGTCHD